MMELCKNGALQAGLAALGEKLSGVNGKAKAKLPKADDVRQAALAVWARLVGLYAAVCVCFRRPGALGGRGCDGVRRLGNRVDHGGLSEKCAS